MQNNLIMHSPSAKNLWKTFSTTTKSLLPNGIVMGFSQIIKK